MSAEFVKNTPTPDRLAANLGRIGGFVGLAAGTVELTVGSSIGPWIGDKNDPTRLGIVTVVLSAVALAAAVSLAGSDRSLRPSHRLWILVAMLVPGLVCFTTVGRLWYVPGVLLVAAGCLAAVGLRGVLRIVAQDIERNGTRILAITLAVLYLGLGLTALGTSGILGVVGALVVINLLLLNPRLPTLVGIGILVAAAVPFAVATWWSAVTPLVATLLVVIGGAAMHSHQDSNLPPAPDQVFNDVKTRPEYATWDYDGHSSPNDVAAPQDPAVR
jgi:hypothetical protein